ncbi:MAG TPA: class I SAM-dependent methyltransferase [Sphingomicrobium sp.]|nr:class I SAM-dependent methyltransferase [Sphingomicrobium sp.]
MSTAALRDHWPEDHLEHLGECPVCKSPARELLFDGLTDIVFRVAPGAWTMWRCASCRSAYLDPRPDRASIGDAYKSYFTHEESEPAMPSGRLALLRHALGNGYRNKRFGLKLEPAMVAGAVVAKLLPSARKAVDIAYRFLPGNGQGRAILDIGCGNGSWLELAREAGWRVHGVEPDPVSSRRAKERGIDVRSDIGELLKEGARFEYITVSHVIEHVHDPVGMLKACYQLLVPGGVLYIDTPNIDALGLKAYGRFWPGLDAPRHLVLFNLVGLNRRLCDIGFFETSVRVRAEVLNRLATASERLARGRSAYDESVRIGRLRTGIIERIRETLQPSRSEFVTLTCRRPCRGQDG